MLDLDQLSLAKIESYPKKCEKCGKMSTIGEIENHKCNGQQDVKEENK